MRLVGETTNPDGRTYVAVSSGNGWGLGRDPVTAIKTAGGSPRLHSIRKPRTTEEDRGWIL